jgi:hypothetical protein
MGQNEPSLFPWSEFIESALTVFENGYDISEKDYRYRFTLIEKDPLLPLLDSQNRREFEKTNGRKSKKNNTTKIGNNIYTALTKAVLEDGVHPEDLTLSGIDLDRIPTDVFIKLRSKHREYKKDLDK